MTKLIQVNDSKQVASLTSAEKAEKRAEVTARRAKNLLAQELMPIAYKQARVVSAKTQVPLDFLIDEAMEAVAKTVRSSDGREYGKWLYAKRTISGLLFNSVRDKYRIVRIPRNLSLLYLAEAKACREDKQFSSMSLEQRAQVLNVTPELLQESRTAVGLFSSQYEDNLAYHGCTEVNIGDRSDHELEIDIAMQVLEQGSRVVANKLGLDSKDVLRTASLAIAKVLRDLANDTEKSG